MEGYIWLILISMLAVGVLFGFVIGRSKGDVSAPKVRELEQNLRDANEEMQNYRTQVTQHFEKTATLFNQLTNDYREVYEHLAKSSNQLCGTETAKIKSLTAEKAVLEGQSEPAAQQSAKPKAPETQKQPESAAAAKPAEEKQPETKAEPQPATEAESAAAGEIKSDERAEEAAATKQTKGDGGAGEATVPPVSKPGAEEETPRTIH